jgi:hypothetical protein
MSDFPPEHPRQAGAQMPALPDQSEVLLRNRDVQALSRSFRRMAEVQEALLEHMDANEGRRSRPWVLPFLAFGSLVLGAGLATVGLLWFQDQQEQRPFEVHLDNPVNDTAPTVHVAAPEVTVQAPDNGVDAALIEAMIARLEKIGDTQEADRRLIAELSGRLVDGELGVMRMLKEMDAQDRAKPSPASARSGDALAATEQPGSQAIPSEGGGGASAAAEPALNPDEIWLNALNGLMAFDGHPDLRFRKGQRVDGQPVLRDVLFLTWGEDRLIDSVVRAERAEFHLQQSTHSLEIMFFEGTRTRGANKTVIAGGGLRVALPEVDLRAWLDHFPALIEGRRFDELTRLGYEAGQASESDAGPTPEVEVASSDAAETTLQGGEETPGVLKEAEASTVWALERVEAMRSAVDALLAVERASGHYRLRKVGGVEGEALLNVQLAWYDANGRLFQYVEADRLEIATRGEGWLEMRFHEGAFRRNDKKTPFQGGVYRLHLSDQDLAAWQAAGAPILTPEP